MSQLFTKIINNGDIYMNTLPSHDLVRKTFNYDPTVGLMMWKTKAPKGKNSIGAFLTGKKNHAGYYRVRWNGENYLVHRLIWFWMTGEWPYLVDHENRIRTDNTWSNLRLGNRKLNAGNMVRGTNKTGYKGVTRSQTKIPSYYAQIKIDGKPHYYGPYPTPEEAHAVYRVKAVEVFGEFANFG